MSSRASALRERLAPRASYAATTASLDDPRAAARFLGYAYAAGAALAIVSMAFPQPPGTDVTGLFGIYAVALAAGVYLLARGSRVTEWETAGALLMGTVLVSLAIHFTEDRTGVYSLFYVWIAIESVYFLSHRAALVQLVGVAVAFGLVLTSERPPGAEEQWLITVGTVVLAGVLVGRPQGERRAPDRPAGLRGAHRPAHRTEQPPRHSRTRWSSSWSAPGAASGR